MTPLIDIGWNAGNEVFDLDRNEVWEKAVQAGVGGAILTGTSFSQTSIIQHLAQSNPAWTYTAGTHPHYAAKHDTQNWEKFWNDPSCVAVGECGLDYFRMLSPKDVQLSTFEWHLNVAVSLNKPVFVHVRNAHNDAVSLLKAFTNAGGRGIVHCFTGTATEGQCYVDMGLSLGCTGWISDYRRNQDMVAAVKTIPLDFWMLETDAPYLTPYVKPALPRRNVPANLMLVAESFAEVSGVDVTEVAAKTTENAKRLFSFKD